ncbi:CDP-alcohol phosphatidyltransferase family protein [Sphingobium boeckii]|uniref:Phosphatidylglycerophosphate synthase n=1 Tax=Sphingobium boeckii TaxID=1082345 RepID=A0A7W9AIA0_9SPHN|nr:CDP-alcohol phosphatidyltransferase family protein [Sphingobium boeckii]MBB5686182.1 phosphatidylglycerophosphate synthase [Sphingobium boeckii]
MTNDTDKRPDIAVIGTNPVKLWGLDTQERTRRIAAAAALGWQDSEAPAPPCVLVNAGFAFDPGWLRHIAAHPGKALSNGGVPVLAYARTEDEARAVAGAMRNKTPLPATSSLDVTAYESGPVLENKELRKRETPFLDRLDADTVRPLERASYFGAYKGVTDILTKYLWPEWALVITRIAARLGITPNMVTAVGAILCVLATFAFGYGHYWAGMAMGLVFMVLDTVDGKLARCTITSSWWGNVFDHGIDLVHPPFWWYAWAVGLAYWGLALSPEQFWFAMIAIVGGYVVQRFVEGAFISSFGMHVHVWEKFDSQFRLITARRNPNMIILFAATAFGRPDLGLIAVAWWTLISLLVHAVRLGQAYLQRARGANIRSWLQAPA